jgi:hypothetical protein
MSDKTYTDKVKCPKGHTFDLRRRIGTANRRVRTYCYKCDQAYKIKAGPLPDSQKGSGDA